MRLRRNILSCYTSLHDCYLGGKIISGTIKILKLYFRIMNPI
jgi:hypothetical protein